MLNFVSVDGYRASWYQVPSESDVSFVLPAATAQKIASLGMSGEMVISIQENKAAFSMDGCTVYGRLLTGSFMEYRRIFPAHEARINVKRKSLLSILERCMVGMDPKIKKPVIVQVDGQKMDFDYSGTATNFHEETFLEEDAPAGIRIGFNPAYLQEALKTFSGEKVGICYKGSVDPICIEEDNLRALVLPVRLSAG